MYKAIVRRNVRTGFRALSAGDYEQVLRQFHPQVIFSFAGPAPLGGERRGVEAVRAWFQRLFSYFPGIQFTVHQVIVQGWPGIPWWQHDSRLRLLALMEVCIGTM